MIAIEEATGYKPEVRLVDLAEFASVSSFAEKYEKEVGRLDIIVANAAIIPEDKTKAARTADGWELTQVNSLYFQFLADDAVAT